MKSDCRLSSALHALLHMAEHDGPTTSETLAKCLATNPVVVRRTMGLLRDAGIVASDRGHAGGWRITMDFSKLNLFQLHQALGEPAIFAIGHRNENPDCLVEQSVNAALGGAFLETEELLYKRLAQITLADLATDFAQRYAARQVFSDKDSVSQYADRAARLVPGLQDLRRMTGLLLDERSPDDAHVLVLGAGGGLELKVFAEMQSSWQFEGIDPSAEMLQLAKTTLGSLASRVHFHEGYIDSAPLGPFDAATCLLTLHFLSEDERRKTLHEVYRRLKTGAPFVVAHHSFPNTDSEKNKWLARSAAFAVASGVPASDANRSINAMKERLPTLSPDQDELLLREAGFSGVELFYAGFTFKGWVCYKA